MLSFFNICFLHLSVLLCLCFVCYLCFLFVLKSIKEPLSCVFTRRASPRSCRRRHPIDRFLGRSSERRPKIRLTSNVREGGCLLSHCKFPPLLQAIPVLLSWPPLGSSKPLGSPRPLSSQCNEGVCLSQVYLLPDSGESHPRPDLDPPCC